jgi:two-component system, cell cycle response regulator DivK
MAFDSQRAPRAQVIVLTAQHGEIEEKALDPGMHDHLGAPVQTRSPVARVARGAQGASADPSRVSSTGHNPRACRPDGKSGRSGVDFALGVQIVARILVVEDSPDNMKLFRTLLTLKGHEVTGLAGGEGLLETIARVEPELALMDIQLPGKDGFTLLSEIRGSPHRGLRVLALTAHAMSGDRERALQAGFDGYITKPIEIRSFPELVRRALAGEAVSH